MSVIQVEDLRKLYGSFPALAGISFDVDRGEVVGFLGPNGAGKSTTMKILTGTLNPTTGRALVAGHDVMENSIEARRRIGYLPENNPLYENQRVSESLRFCGKLRGMGGAELKERIEVVVDQTDLWPKYRAPISTLSKGFRQRVGLAQALLHDPEILILDEPTVGLDPNQVVEVRSLISRVGEGCTVILCSHILSEVEAVCGRVIIIHNGRIVGDGTLPELARALQDRFFYVLTLRASAEAVKPVVAAVPGVEAVTVEADAGERATLRFETRSEDTAPAVVGALTGAGYAVEALVPRQPSLEDVFRAMTAAEEVTVS